MAFGINRGLWETGTRALPFFVPGVKSKIHTSLPIHLSTRQPGRKGCGSHFPLLPAAFGASPALLWTGPSPRSLAGEGASKEEAVRQGPSEVTEPLLKHSGAQRCSLSKESKLIPGGGRVPHSRSATCLDTVGALDQ